MLYFFNILMLTKNTKAIVFKKKKNNTVELKNAYNEQIGLSAK